MSTPSSPTRSPSIEKGTTVQEQLNTLKRKYEQLVRKSGKKRRNPNHSTMERARGIRKVASLYTNISVLAAVALAQDEGGDSDDDETVSEEERRTREIE